MRKCEVCGKSIKDENVRTCSESCVEELMRRDEVDAQENALQEEYNY